MGVTAYLEITSSIDEDPGRSDSRALSYAKSFLPGAWFFFFEPADFAELRSKTDGSSYTLLRREKTSALTLAEDRLTKLRPFASAELSETLGWFFASVAKTKGSFIVLNSHRMESTKDELVAPLKWLRALSTRSPSAKRIAQAQELFDGFDWLDEPEADEPLLDLTDEYALIGAPLEALATLDRRAPTVVPPPVTPDAALMGVYAHPHSLETRIACGEALAAQRDPRGELILLDCHGAETMKQSRRHEKLWEQYRSEVERPIRRAGLTSSDTITMQQGFPAVVRLTQPVPGPFGPEWSTVHTIELRGHPHFFVRPELWWLRRVIVSAPDVLELARHQMLPFSSIVIDDSHSDWTWAALRDSPAFAHLLEVFVVTFKVWLPLGAQQLIQARPHLSVRSQTTAPSDDPRALEPLSPDAHHARVARWSAPPQGAQLAGARFDNQ